MEIHYDEHFGIKKAEILKMKRILEWMKTPVDNGWLQQQQRDFYLFYKEHDKRRGTNFLETFPQMEKFYLYCSKLAIDYKK